MLLNGKRRRAAVGLVALALLLDLTGIRPCDAAARRAWAPGERLEYSVKFGIFSAGTSVFAVNPAATTGGEKTLRFSSMLHSSPNFFITIIDDATSFSEVDSLRTLRYEKTQQEGSKTTTNVTVFNHTAASAVRTEDGQAHPPIHVTPGARDVLGVIYHVRSQPLEVGKSFKIPVHDGRRDYTMEVVVPRRETISVPAGTFNCVVVEPKLWNEDGSLYKRSQMTLWMTDDARHVPVRVKMSLFFGSIVASLEKSSGVLPPA